MHIYFTPLRAFSFFPQHAHTHIHIQSPSSLSLVCCCIGTSVGTNSYKLCHQWSFNFSEHLSLHMIVNDFQFSYKPTRAWLKKVLIPYIQLQLGVCKIYRYFNLPLQLTVKRYCAANGQGPNQPFEPYYFDIFSTNQSRNSTLTKSLEIAVCLLFFKYI